MCLELFSKERQIHLPTIFIERQQNIFSEISNKMRTLSNGIINYIYLRRDYGMENKPQMPAQPLSNPGQSSLSSESGNAPSGQNYSQMLTQPLSSQQQSAPSPEPGDVPSGQDYSQMLTQPLSNPVQSSLSSEPGNAPSGQDYSQMPPNQSYQQVSPLPDQASVLGVQLTGLPRVS